MSYKYDKVLMTGFLLGFASFCLPNYLVYRPNRLVEGKSLNIFQVLNNQAMIMLVLWGLVLFLTLFLNKSRLKEYALLIVANSIFVLTFVLPSFTVNKLPLEITPITRFSFGTALWLSALAAHTIIFRSLQRLALPKLLNSLLLLSGPLLVILAASAGLLDQMSLIKEYLNQKERFTTEFLQHLMISGAAVSLGTLGGIFLGILAYFQKKLENPIFFVVNTVQTIPSLALFGLLIAPLALLAHKFPLLRTLGIDGVGWAPALIALTLYALLPICLNTFTSLKSIPEAIREAGIGMGMSKFQLLSKVEFPLAVPVALTGIRTATIQAIGNTALAALIGAGGLGTFIFQGLGQSAPDLILLGAIPVIFIAFIADLFFEQFIKLLTPKGIAGGKQ